MASTCLPPPGTGIRAQDLPPLLVRNRNWPNAQPTAGVENRISVTPGAPFPRLEMGALTVPISCHFLPPLLVPITSEQFLPHRAAPSTQPRCAVTQVTELALNDAGTGVPRPVWPPGAPGAARAVPGRRATAQVMAMAAARTAEAVRLIHVLPCLGSGSAPVAPLRRLSAPEGC